MKKQARPPRTRAGIAPCREEPCAIAEKDRIAAEERKLKRAGGNRQKEASVLRKEHGKNR